MTYARISLLFVAAFMAGTSSSFAALLLPNSSVTPTAVLPIAGTVVDAAMQSFTGLDKPGNVVFTGSETTAVLSGDSGNTFGG